MHSDEFANYYRSHGYWTDPGGYGRAIEALPADVSALACIVRGLLVHGDYLSLYDLQPADVSSCSRDTLPVSVRLEQVLSLDNASLADTRAPARRASGTCRDYALMLCTFLREKSVPARVRCGFAGYFAAGEFEDHWVCEYRDADSGNWCIADAQLDAEHRSHLSIGFDTVNLPSGEFLSSDQAWELCRSGDVDGARFGHGEAVGQWFLMVNLARDFLALRKQEVSDWDGWREAQPDGRNSNAAELEKWDEMAEMISSVDSRCRELDQPPAAIEQALAPFWRR